MTGWLNVDATSPAAELNCDIRELTLSGVRRVEMNHVLEHIPHRDVPALLERIRSWMVPGGELRVEVPDLEVICRDLDGQPDWQRYVYGDQRSDGEFHRSGFTPGLLVWKLVEAGFDDLAVRRFTSQFVTRTGMPCLEARAVA